MKNFLSKINDLFLLLMNDYRNSKHSNNKKLDINPPLRLLLMKLSILAPLFNKMNLLKSSALSSSTTDNNSATQIKGENIIFQSFPNT